jgi:hypothetical protein
LAQKISELTKPIKVKKGSKKYLRCVAKSIMAWFFIMKEADRTRLKKREEAIEDLEAGLGLYTDIAKGWVFKAIKHPL